MSKSEHRIRTYEYATQFPGQVAVCQDDWEDGMWEVWRGTQLVGRYFTHANAINAADRLARS